MPRLRRIHLLHVTLIADEPELLESLESYLRGAGVSSNATRHIESASEMTPPSSSAVVLFPDDFAAEQVDSALADLRTARPAALPALVARDTRRFESLAGFQLPPLLLAKPASGWTILDAIRFRLDQTNRTKSSG